MTVEPNRRRAASLQSPWPELTDGQALGKGVADWMASHAFQKR